MHYALFCKRFIGVEGGSRPEKRTERTVESTCPVHDGALGEQQHVSGLCDEAQSNRQVARPSSSTPDSSYATEPTSSAATRWVTDGVTPLIGRPLILPECLFIIVSNEDAAIRTHQLQAAA
ncbi:hypothetical protein PG996_003854 [Apiospora saccharicola]|uniref:Uncharacterized protein n=1 Tax=Apiospora saccharicola TaxID=335842 RepID=A0ABR1W2H9_9PEZI